jgi:formate dehydrogenase major subunit
VPELFLATVRNVVTGEPFRRIVDRIASWPLARELANLGMGPEAISEETREWSARILDADEKIASVCPYCAVGCGQLIYVKDGAIVAVEGNPESPINQGTLCPKGAATYELINNPRRWTTVRYRAPYSDHWEERPLDWAMDRIARLVKEARDETWVERNATGQVVNQARGIASLGGATLDNEENYLIKKLLTGGLGMVWVENQARV